MTAGVCYGCDDAVAKWVADRLPLDDFGPCSSLGVVCNGKLIAGVVYHTFDPKSRTIQLSMAADSPRWAKTTIIRELLAYPFNQLDVFKAWLLTEETNRHCQKTMAHIGFSKEADLRHQFGPNQHAVMMAMTLPEFKERYNGQRKLEAA